MTREDAIKIVRSIYQTGAEKEALATLIPELAEKVSEEEKIRREIADFVQLMKRKIADGMNDIAIRKEDDAMFDRWLSYLEKQKTSEDAIRYVKENHSPDEVSDFQAAMNIAVAKAYDKGVQDTLKKQKEQEPIKVYRVENEKEQKGLWRKFDGTWEPLFDILTDGLCRDLPMEDNDLYRSDGKQWFASAPSRQTLQKWFSKRDLEELTSAGFTISEFEVRNYKKVSEFEYIFTRDSITKRTYLNVSDIYPEQKPAEWSEEDKERIRQNGRLDVCYNPEKYGLCHKGEWSEEDKSILDEAIAMIEARGCWIRSEDAVKRVSNFLKSLRPQPQRRDTYYDIIHDILATLKDMDFTQITPEHRVSLLNDIRVKCKNADECAEILDEPHWKPSEEQMRFLSRVESELRVNGHTIAASNMAKLYDDLKKLMEE